ncbi:MAG TPA: ABC transporter substrate-binding protein [Acidimicrobiales bacterium]|nr:ABC transporter substrate-binding protein [Acidimicrobiales bacterium]
MAALLVACLVAGACSRSSSKSSSTSTTGSSSATTAAPNSCTGAQLQATDVGVTPTDITIEVMADVGSPLAPGLFQGNLDGVNAFAAYVNAHGGIACRQLKVRTWDSKLDPSESKNGLIDACSNAFAMVGSNALFNPDVSPMTNCVDKTGAATGLPDIAALANDLNEQCAPTAFIIQAVSAKCPVQSGVAPWSAIVGPTKWYLQQDPGLHGIYMVPGDLPTTVQSATYQIAAQQQVGITWDGTPKVSGADAQPAYTPRVQTIKAKGSTYVYDGSNDVAMIRIRKEAAAQGVSTVKVWSCSLACYTNAFIPQGGSDVEGTYLWMQFLPFEEASYNAQDQAYVTALGSKATSWGAQAWQAGLAFQQAVNAVVAKSGPNGVTRAAVLTALKGITNFTADGWMGTKSLQGAGSISQCFLVMQVKNGKFTRVYPTQPGTMDCNAGNVLTVNVDPVAEAAKLK